ncbi:MAG: SigB/SigF/SigG family RNA polymerase sigma factor [Hespellia sp.]|nr:SigB/SigF/SigG family RNA polymerase sigma factor [Hespellia sp.]
MDHTIALIKQAHDGDKEARQQVVEENVGLVWCVVRRFFGRGTEKEDLFQIGVIGLLKAIDKFDLSYDVKFSTYAVPMISGEIKRFLRDDGMIRVSRSLKELSAQIFMMREKIISTQGQEPTLEELAEALHVEKEMIVQAMESSVEVESIYRPIYQKDGDEIALVDKLEDKERKEERVLNHLMLAQLLNLLGNKERKLIYMRYFEERSQTQIGNEMGMTQVQVSRMEKKILEKLRKDVYFST